VSVPRHRAIVLALLAMAGIATGRGAPDSGVAARPWTATDPPGALTEPAWPLAAPDSLMVRGRVLDGERDLPLRDAAIWSGSRDAVTDADGSFSLGPLPAGSLLFVKLPGYARARAVAEPGPLTIRLQPQVIRGVYLSYYGLGDARIRRRVLDLVERTELNGLVIDVKGDRGMIPYPTRIPLALAAGAQGPVRVENVEGLLAAMHDQGVYTVARIVAFKDTVLAHHQPGLAVSDSETGRPWLDNEGLGWVDPFREEVWAYLIAVAREAAAKGFDEIQFDYLRFPSDGRLGAARYARPNTPANRLAAITRFLARTRRELGPTGVFLSVAVFGYTAFNEDDTQIGQRVEDLASQVDYLCPMVYPSGYHLGIPGVPNPVAHPYEVARETIGRLRRRSAATPARIRPWVQDFRDYAFDRRPFGVAEIRAQIRGATEGGAVGWMLWNPRNDYTEEALGPAPGRVPPAVR
jgi:hypothetical protein